MVQNKIKNKKQAVKTFKIPIARISMINSNTFYDVCKTFAAIGILKVCTACFLFFILF
jgi:hypothetical protein